MYTDVTIEVDPELALVSEDIGTIGGCIIGGSETVMVEVRTIDFCDPEEDEAACGGMFTLSYTS